MYCKVEQLLVGGGQTEDEVKEGWHFMVVILKKTHSCPNFICSMQTIRLRKELAFMTFCLL